jgi:hypothetical protein
LRCPLLQGAEELRKKRSIMASGGTHDHEKGDNGRLKVFF